MDKKQKGGPVTIRYRTTDVPGKIMVHCHNSLHADTGMIQKEYVRNVTDGSNSDGGFCLCDYFEAISGPGIVGDVGGAASDASSSASKRPGRGPVGSTTYLVVTALLATAAVLGS